MISSHPTPPPSSPSTPYEFSKLKHVFLGLAMDTEASVRHLHYSSTGRLLLMINIYKAFGYRKLSPLHKQKRILGPATG
jgi:hypothetical protein